MSGEARRAISPRLSDEGKALLGIPRVAKFLEALIEGEDIRVAARSAKLRVKRGRLLLQDPAVRRAYFQGIERIRDSERARNLKTALMVRDRGIADGASAAQQKVSLQAVAYLDGADSRPGHDGQRRCQRGRVRDGPLRTRRPRSSLGPKPTRAGRDD